MGSSLTNNIFHENYWELKGSRILWKVINGYFTSFFRFQYPERPTLFFAMCYLGVSLVCLVGLISPSSIVCSDKIVNEDNVIEHGNGLIQGATSRPCTILFMLFFYFSSKFPHLKNSFWTKNGRNQSF